MSRRDFAFNKNDYFWIVLILCPVFGLSDVFMVRHRREHIALLHDFENRSF